MKFVFLQIVSVNKRNLGKGESFGVTSPSLDLHTCGARDITTFK